MVQLYLSCLCMWLWSPPPPCAFQALCHEAWGGHSDTASSSVLAGSTGLSWPNPSLCLGFASHAEPCVAPAMLLGVSIQLGCPSRCPHGGHASLQPRIPLYNWCFNDDFYTY